MKIEMLEKVMHGREVFESGDVRTVDDALGAYFCECGWAKDVEGAAPTGARNTNEVRLAPDNVIHEQSASEVK